MGIECNSIRLQRTGTQAESGKNSNQGRMKHSRVSSDSELDGGAGYERSRPASAGGGILGWFALPQGVKPPQKRDPWHSRRGLKLYMRFPSQDSIEAILSEKENRGSQQCIIEFSLKDLG